jgi:ATP-dependent RNA helicase MSS116, mitochondrial
VIQKILQRDPELAQRGGRRGRVTSSDVRAIIVSPTRELAEQIATEARKVTSSTGLVVQCATGGTQKRVALQKMQYEGCHILVGTPGRLNDILSDPSTGVAAPNLGAFVLDEADRLLDDGFLPDIGRMQQQLPNRAQVDRQTLLFSATVPDELMSVIRTTMKPDFQFVRTVGRDEIPTHEKVPQKIVECRAIQNQLAALYELSFRETRKANAGEGKPYKAIVYFSSTAEVSLAANTFNNLRDSDGGSEAMFGSNPLHPAQIMEIHSKLTQHERTRTADLFRRAKSAILFSSDVTARGMDFPDVTHVIQLGLPQTRDQYIHRLGRTARAHKTGEGWLILSTVEMKEYRGLLRDLPIKPDDSLAAATVNMTTPGQLPRSLAMILSQLGEATKRVDRVFKVKAYAAALALYSRHSSSKQIIVDILNEWARFGWGFPEPPKLSSSTVSKLGYSRCNGLNIDDSRRSYDRPSDSRGGFYGRGSGSGSGSGRFGGGGRPGYGSSGGGGGSEPYVPGGRGYGQRREGGYDSQPRSEYSSRSSRNDYGSRPSRNDYGSPRRDDFNRGTREFSP